MTAPFTVTFSGTVTLALDEVWPDGDNPADPSPADVAELMQQAGLRRLLSEWDFESYLEIDVDGVPVHAR